jgi:hypothetical protein
MNITLILLRVVHIGLGVFWAGGVFVTALFLIPTVGAIGPAGVQFMRHLVQVRKYSAIVAASGIITILAGLALYMRMMALTDGTFARGHTGMAYGVGGAFAILALIPGIGIGARVAGQLSKLGASIEASGAPPTAEQAVTIKKLQRRLALGARSAAALIGVATVIMAIARYL